MTTIRKGNINSGFIQRGTVFGSEFGDEVIGISITSASIVDAVTENSGANQSIYTATARDPDGGTSGFTFSVSGTDVDNGFITINSTTGVVTLVPNPNYETKASYSFIVSATKSGFVAGFRSLVVSINNVDEVAPTFITGTTATALDENNSANATVYTATANDNDIATGGQADLQFTIGGTDGNAFDIDAATGVVTIKGVADYETKASYEFDITATDAAGNATTQTVTLAINDLFPIFTVVAGPALIADNGGTFVDGTGSGGGISGSFLESISNQSTFFTFSGTDVTSDTTFSLSGTDAGQFEVVNNNSDTVFIRPNYTDPGFNSFDRETKASYSFNITATKGTETKTFAVNLSVTDVNDTAPVITSGNTATGWLENSATGTLVYTATATDADGTGENITFAMSGTDASSFSINSATGEVTSTVVPDYETKNQYSITITASDGTNTSSALQVTINVSNQQDIAPTWNSNSINASVVENSASGTAVLSILVSPASGNHIYDPDDTLLDGSLRYSIQSGNTSNAFSIDSNGVLRVSGATTIDYETQATYVLTVAAHYKLHTGGVLGSVQSVNTTIVVSVTDVAENPPSFTSSTSFTVPEMLGFFNYNAAIHTLSATGDTPITYSFDSSSENTDQVNINPTTGAITLNRHVWYQKYDEDTQFRDFVVKATNSAGSTTQNLRMNVSEQYAVDLYDSTSSSKNEFVGNNIYLKFPDGANTQTGDSWYRSAPLYSRWAFQINDYSVGGSTFHLSTSSYYNTGQGTQTTPRMNYQNNPGGVTGTAGNMYTNMQEVILHDNNTSKNISYYDNGQFGGGNITNFAYVGGNNSDLSTVTWSQHEKFSVGLAMYFESQHQNFSDTNDVGQGYGFRNKAICTFDGTSGGDINLTDNTIDCGGYDSTTDAQAERLPLNPGTYVLHQTTQTSSSFEISSFPVETYNIGGNFNGVQARTGRGVYQVELTDSTVDVNDSKTYRILKGDNSGDEHDITGYDPHTQSYGNPRHLSPVKINELRGFFGNDFITIRAPIASDNAFDPEDQGTRSKGENIFTRHNSSETAHSLGVGAGYWFGYVDGQPTAVNEDIYASGQIGITMRGDSTATSAGQLSTFTADAGHTLELGQIGWTNYSTNNFVLVIHGTSSNSGFDSIQAHAPDLPTDTSADRFVRTSATFTTGTLSNGTPYARWTWNVGSGPGGIHTRIFSNNPKQPKVTETADSAYRVVFTIAN